MSHDPDARNGGQKSPAQAEDARRRRIAERAPSETPRDPVEGDDASLEPRGIIPQDLPRRRRAPLPERNIEQAAETAEPRVSIRKKELKSVYNLLEQIRDDLVDVQNGDLVTEILETGVRLLRDQTNRGDIKLIDKSFRELRYALKVFAPYRDFHKVSIFGSARTPEDHPDYRQALAYGQAMEKAEWMVITGAGGGIMAAGHGGAGAKGSFGLNISLPFEQSANAFIHGDPKLIDFKYFFTRKLMFVRSSHAVALFPGGFGTMDEAYEVLTLIQTGKCPPMPVILVDHPGGTYWTEWDRWLRNHLLADRLISAEDLALYKITDSVEEAVAETLRFYRNFHSMRYARDLLIIRMKHKLTDAQTADVREKFGDIAVEDAWRCCGPLKVERNESKLRHLHRLVFPFNRRDHGRLRQLIDHLNDLQPGEGK